MIGGMLGTDLFHLLFYENYTYLLKAVLAPNSIV